MFDQREIVNICVGQCGIGMGNALWELLPAEHGIGPNGKIIDDSPEAINTRSCSHCAFEDVGDNRFVPRTIMTDLEHSVLDEVRCGSYRGLFHPDSLISYAEDAANVFSRGLFTVGQLATDTILERLRKIQESCENLQCIMFYRSLCGGTGTGLTSALLENLTDFGKTPFFEVPVLPSPTLSSSILEPYNAVLAEHFCMEDIDMSFLIDNEAVYDLLSKYASCQSPTFTNVNRILAHPFSALTASMRFRSTLYNDIVYLQTNLVPYPRIHFPIVNVSPMMGKDQALHQALDVGQITNSAFERDNQLVKVDKVNGRYMCCALMYRGAATPRKVYTSLARLKTNKNLKFVDWCPTGFKVGIVEEPPTMVPGSLLAPTPCSLTVLSNNSAIGMALQRMTHKFHMMFSKRAYVHWYVSDGLEEGEFTEAIYNLATLVKDYAEVSLNSEELESYISQNPRPESVDNETQEVNIHVALSQGSISGSQARALGIGKKVTSNLSKKSSGKGETATEMTRCTSPTEDDPVNNALNNEATGTSYDDL